MKIFSKKTHTHTREKFLEKRFLNYIFFITNVWKKTVFEINILKSQNGDKIIVQDIYIEKFPGKVGFQGILLEESVFRKLFLQKKKKKIASLGKIKKKTFSQNKHLVENF